VINITLLFFLNYCWYLFNWLVFQIQSGCSVRWCATQRAVTVDVMRLLCYRWPFQTWLRRAATPTSLSLSCRISSCKKSAASFRVT